MSKKSDKVKMEEEIKVMQKHMAGLVRTILDLKSKGESLEKKLEGDKNDDLEELINKQKVVDEAISANSAAILKIDQEIQVLSDNAKTEVTADSQDNTVNKDGTVTVDKK